MTKKRKISGKCDFCGKELKDIRKSHKEVFLIEGDNLDLDNQLKICSACIENNYNLIKERVMKKNAKQSNELYNLTPSDIKKHLDKHVVGQDTAKKRIAQALYNHFKLIKRLDNNPDANKELRIKKSNVIMYGPSGSGKTEIFRALIELGIPVSEVNATAFTSTGYVGKDVTEMFKPLISMTNGDVSRAQKGVVFIDEFDKLRGEFTRSGQKDINGVAVQESILKILEGEEVEIKKDKGEPGSTAIKFDTTNVLFILCGAFVGIDKIVDERLKKKSNKSALGFGSNIQSKKDSGYNDIVNDISNEDLVEFGILEEVVGRCPIKAPLRELTISELISILTEPKHALTKQKDALLKLDDSNIKLNITDVALEKIADKAKKIRTGARALETILSEILENVSFDLPDMVKDENINITEIKINDELQCEYIYAE